jgi:hypothetical protein
MRATRVASVLQIFFELIVVASQLVSITGRLLKHFKFEEMMKGLSEELYSRTGNESHQCGKFITFFSR